MPLDSQRTPLERFSAKGGCIGVERPPIALAAPHAPLALLCADVLPGDIHTRVICDIGANQEISLKRRFVYRLRGRLVDATWCCAREPQSTYLNDSFPPQQCSHLRNAVRKTITFVHLCSDGFLLAFAAGIGSLDGNSFRTTATVRIEGSHRRDAELASDGTPG
jgi:hypothetical protein